MRSCINMAQTICFADSCKGVLAYIVRHKPSVSAGLRWHCRGAVGVKCGSGHIRDTSGADPEEVRTDGGRVRRLIGGPGRGCIRTRGPGILLHGDPAILGRVGEAISRLLARSEVRHLGCWRRRRVSLRTRRLRTSSKRFPNARSSALTVAWAGSRVSVRSQRIPHFI